MKQESDKLPAGQLDMSAALLQSSMLTGTNGFPYIAGFGEHLLAAASKQQLMQQSPHYSATLANSCK